MPHLTERTLRKKMGKAAVAGGKRRVESSEAPAVLGCAELGGKVAATADVMVVPAAGGSFVDAACGI